MAFKTTLFKLLNEDVTIIVNNYEIETVQDDGEDAAGNPVLRCECDDDNEWYFADQEVLVDEGVCQAATAVGDWVDGEESFNVSIAFYVTRPLQESDLSS